MFIFIAKHLAFIFIKSLQLSYRFRYVGVENIQKAYDISNKESFLMASWHQKLLHCLLAQGNKKLVTMASRSKDGTIIAHVAAKLGKVVVRGSSSRNGKDKGGKSANMQLIEHVKDGISGGLTVDGPLGPAFKVKAGIIDAARKTGACIVPCVAISENYWSFNSWDKFRVPKPFSRIVMVYGEPIYVRADVSSEDFFNYQGKLKKSLDFYEEQREMYFSDWSKLSKKNF